MATPANKVDTDEVLYDVSEHVAAITINRPDAQNTISGPMLDALTRRLLEADADNDVRAIIVTGSGRFFCAGLDLRGGGIAGGLSSQGSSPANLDLRNTPPTVLHSLDTPTICALNGSAAGYGMDLALGCDIRIMADTAKLAAAFTARGVVPESGGTWILPRLLGWSKAAEIIFTGRTLLAEECKELGLVSHVVPTDEIAGAARSLAQEIASNAPLAVQASKRMMRMGMNETFNDHVHHVYLQLLPLFRSEDFREGMASFMEKRKAEFKGQ
ncbi:MAG: enoyl-CoA hydratase/isomerase family protein [Pseudomonadales bacterium]|nr:enoyl-CoA hydratase/isomerase family protein [Pseudomonadales bacterium]NIX07326.1 enoyl-CoA hydratase/isomerase family protein [Pseudomonadales bacterium]